MNIEDLNAYISEKLKSEEGKRHLKGLILLTFPEEYCKVLVDFIEGEKKLDEDEMKDLIHNNILDNYNEGKRSKKEMELLFRGDWSLEDLELLKSNEKKIRREKNGS
jgi:hypothetical protein